MNDAGQYFRRYLGGAALLAICAGLVLASPAAAAKRPLSTGVMDVGRYDRESLRAARRAGATMVRIPAGWGSVAPQQLPGIWNPADPADPHYDWEQTDRMVASAVAAGLTPLLIVDGAPRWAQRCSIVIVNRIPLCDPDPIALGQFATAAAQRYSGRVPGIPRVRHWQALNEPNLSLFFNPQFDGAGRPLSPELYRALLNSFYDGVKSAHRSNVVVAAGLGPIAAPRQTIGPMLFTRRLLCMAGRRRPHPARGNCAGGIHFDAFAIHPYTTGGPDHRGRVDDVQLGDLPKMQRLLRAADRAGRIRGSTSPPALWVTEFSWDSRPPDPRGTPMRTLTRWTAEALHRAWRAGVSHFLWFLLHDGGHAPGQPYSVTFEAGLYFRGGDGGVGKAKPAMAAFRFPFVAYRRGEGIRFWGRTANARRGRVVVEARKGGGWRTLAVTRANAVGVFQGRAPTDYGRGLRGFVRARHRGRTSVPFSMRPVRDRFQRPFG